MELVLVSVELWSNITTAKKIKEGEVEIDYVQTNESVSHPGTCRFKTKH